MSPFTVPCVPTGMNMGVRAAHSPRRANCIAPVRARPHVAVTSNDSGAGGVPPVVAAATTAARAPPGLAAAANPRGAGRGIFAGLPSSGAPGLPCGTPSAITLAKWRT